MHKKKQLTKEIERTLKSIKNKKYQNKLIKMLIDSNFDYKDIANAIGRKKENVYQMWYQTRRTA